jgi:hypothetical protein
MSKPNSLAVQFPQLNQSIPEKLTLLQWQYLYREVIFSMGMRILQLFPQEALGANPFDVPSGKGGPTGGPQPGPHPSPTKFPVQGAVGPHEDTGKGGPTGGPQPALSVAQAALGLTGIPETLP